MLKEEKKEARISSIFLRKPKENKPSSTYDAIIESAVGKINEISAGSCATKRVSRRKM